MVTQSVHIDTLDKIRSLVEIVNNHQGRFELISGSTHVNARSAMGIFSLDISRPVLLNIYNEDCADEVIRELSATLS